MLFRPCFEKNVDLSLSSIAFLSSYFQLKSCRVPENLQAILIKLKEKILVKKNWTNSFISFKIIKWFERLILKFENVYES